MSNRVTIKTIAQDLGISHMTVSRALSNSPKVRETTRKTIQKRAAELDYVKSIAAATMRGDRTTTVGLLLPNLTNEFYARLANMLAICLEKVDLQLIIHLTNDELFKEKQALLKLKEIQVRGVVLVPTIGTEELEENLFQGMQVIQLIRKTNICVPYQTVQIKDRQAIVDAVTHLVNHNHRKIAYIGADITLSSGADRLSAFKEGLNSAGPHLKEDWIVTDKPSFEMGYRAAQSLVKQRDVTAIVCGGMEISNGALNGCLERGIRIPQDFAFIGYGDPSYYQWIRGGISTIRLPVDILAQYVSDKIYNGGTEEEYNNYQKLLQAELIVR